ncbi:class I SAM-dependent methyltransferase [Branchiibius sp. NY16-3462-2]|uniref:class I SAM-dependent methyltransferase n=1 Tax=Branchiibius sp. NY16-3462-2 TaxID=1807500 RepID=UPI0007947A2C|nr:class I SAM-dependent methyltransferase [Branchiibius sp. NY16-3462-2]KYH43085.1 hypothetical protein AZH51_06455 [Branchiibius sp. NY16-3462-2]
MTATDDWVLAEAFDRAAPTYDAMVALSPGYHQQLRSAADALIDALGDGDARVLDLGCGSGASTTAILQARSDAGRRGGLQLSGVDASAGMIAEARQKQWTSPVDLVVADAIEYLRQLPDDSVDGVLAAYLLRNVDERDALLEQLARVLKPGGALVIHDYSVAGSRRARAVWAAVCHAIIIPLAAIKGSDVPLHRYLYVSVRDFDSVATVCARMQAAGLVNVRHRSFPGWQNHVVHTFAGSMPA